MAALSASVLEKPVRMKRDLSEHSLWYCPEPFEPSVRERAAETRAALRLPDICVGRVPDILAGVRAASDSQQLLVASESVVARAWDWTGVDPPHLVPIVLPA